MGNLHPNLGLLTDLDSLGHSLQQQVTLAPDVTGIDATVVRYHPRQADYLLGPSIETWRIKQSGREPPRPLFHSLRHQSLHLRLLLSCRLHVVEAQYRSPHRVVADQGHYVHSSARVAQMFQVFGHARPRDVHANALGLSPCLLHSCTQQRGRRKPAVANDLRGHPLANFALGAGIGQQGEVGVSVGINEAGSQVQA